MYTDSSRFLWKFNGLFDKRVVWITKIEVNIKWINNRDLLELLSVWYIIQYDEEMSGVSSDIFLVLGSMIVCLKLNKFLVSDT